jgi:hypothetical protein
MSEGRVVSRFGACVCVPVAMADGVTKTGAMSRQRRGSHGLRDRNPVGGFETPVYDTFCPGSCLRRVGSLIHAHTGHLRRLGALVAKRDSRQKASDLLQLLGPRSPKQQVRRSG